MSKQKADINSETLILNAARKVFTEKGYSGTRMQDIAEEAGMNQALLHYYFRNKEKLFDQIFDYELRQFLNSFSQMWLEDKPLLDILEHIIEVETRRFSQSPHIPFFLMHELGRNADRLRQQAVKSQLQNLPSVRIVAKIQQAIDNNEILPIAPAQLIVLVMSLAVFPFMAKPIIRHILQADESAFDSFITENVRFSQAMLRSTLRSNVQIQS